MRARGFTLVEMLVTLTLVALVTGLLWQALATVARLELSLARTRTLSDDDALRRAWLELALTGVVTGPSGDARHFAGQADTLTAYSTMPPWSGTLGPEAMTLELVDDPDGQHLLARRSDGGAAQELWRWPATDGHFEYLGPRGEWHARWPPPLGEAPRLPTAVRLSGPPGGPVLVPITTGQNPMLRRQDVELDDGVVRR
jgi:prepilin-type N-terminal cleavage/methylation domain-containing protein